MIKIFQKQPIIVEAMQYDGTSESAEELIQWSKNKLFLYENNVNVKVLLVSTLEGTLEVSETDWVIKGIQGEFYPCKADIFNETYLELRSA